MSELRLKSTGTLKLFESDNTSSVTIASPASLGADRTVTLPDASVTLASGTMLATDGSGASLTALNASELGSGTVPTARLGSGTASSSTVLYGDQTYKTEPGGGKILQVVNDTSVALTTNSTTSFADAGNSVDITPSATSSHILVHISIPFYMYRGPGTTSCRFAWKILRDATAIAEDTVANNQGILKGSAETVFGFPWSYSIYDSPSTTSATTYKCQYKNLEAGSIVTMVNGSEANMTAMEIDGS
tara:strand:+ start:116 stop:853 length:738 start_codon:yes stop_codon:yes gene_type:complete